jgi:hypothetical protein
MEAQTKTVVVTLAWVAIVLLCVKGCMELVKPPEKLPIVGAPVVAPMFKYTRYMCDDQTYLHYENADPLYFDVPLKEECFSGYVFLPVRWQTWRVQFVGKDHTAWVAYWYQGWPQARGPVTYETVMTSEQDERFPSRMVRLQGKGTLRFFKIN